jgi:hypothetical protein
MMYPIGCGGFTVALERAQLAQRQRLVAVLVGGLQPLGQVDDELGARDFSVAVRVHELCPLGKVGLAEHAALPLRVLRLSDLPDIVDLVPVEDSVGVDVHALEDRRARRLDLAELQRAVAVGVHFLEPGAHAFDVRRAGVAGKGNC